MVSNGEAFVTMNYEAHANNASSITAAAGASWRWITSLGAAAWCGGRRGSTDELTMSVPPEPDDVNWENVNIEVGRGTSERQGVACARRRPRHRRRHPDCV